MLNLIPVYIRETFFLWLFGFVKIPMLFYLRPIVLKKDDESIVIKIKHKRRSKNHLGSLYFGVLAAGADCAGGLVAMREIQKTGNKVSLAFKDFHADFLKRAEGDTLFTCTQGPEILELVHKALNSDERQTMPLKIVATCPDKLGDEPVANFTLTLALKKKALR
jgi:acyl-coenzyme A thioesterase PaaI-like protein